MRDYQIDELPNKPIVRIEPIEPDRLPRIAEMGLKLLTEKGYRADDPAHVKDHLMGDGTKPPRIVGLLIASQAIKELQFAGLPPTRETKHITGWLYSLPDEAVAALMRECVIRTS